MAPPKLLWLVKRSTYQDSLRLMEMHAAAITLPGVADAACVMATERNQQLLASRGLLPQEISAGAEDLVIVVRGEEPLALEAALRVLEDSLAVQPATADAAGWTSPAPSHPRTLDSAIERLAGANVALISVPGAYAAAVATRALHRGLHVHLFSDNVSIDEEIALKRLAHEQGLLMMGPDCGTSILNGRPLGFANIVRRGPVGIVGASGTGIQEASVLLDRLCVGVSHAIGVGGRDLSQRVAGLMALDALAALEQDPATRAILLISKPPAKHTLERVLAWARSATKPVVVCFFGAGEASLGDVESAQTIDEAVLLAARCASGADYQFDGGPIDLDTLVRAEQGRLRPTQTRVCGLYVGGSLALEARVLLDGVDNTVVDLGDDEFTQGRPHPMIDPSLRAERLGHATMDPHVAVVLCDVVLGLGSHPDPAGALVAGVRRARSAVASTVRQPFPAVVASVCGTRADPQGLDKQERTLQDAGIVVLPTNAQAARAAAAIAARAAGVPV
jgi:FdrA protein